MFPTKALWLLGISSAVGAVVASAGCGTSPSATGQTAAATPPTAATAPPNAAPQVNSGEEQHAHLPGVHGGTIVPIGRDSYHAEVVFEKGGILRLHTLGRDEAKVEEVALQTLTAYAKAEGETESTMFKLEPKPQSDDTRGKTSVFVGALPTELVGKRVEVTIPSMRIGEDRFRLGFKSDEGAGHAENMPDEEAGKLFLTPGGAYTEDDIAANGRQTAAQKFRGFVPTHDLFPKPGDKICPITLTKANPKCAWIVGGKSYEFCCPPCVEEFVKLAKLEPVKIQEPDQYVKRVETDETKRR